MKDKTSRPSWWNALRKTLRPDGEMLLVADRAQDLYGRNDLWTEQAMEGAGFNGPWATLETSYRMPRALIDLTANYVATFLSDRQITLPIPPDQQQLAVDPLELHWMQVPPNRIAEAAVEAIRMSISRANGTSPAAFADVVLLCDRKELGQSIVARLGQLGVKTTHTFAPDRKLERRQKLYFFKGDSRVKATTIHSFKGWEGRHIVLATGDAGGQRAHSAVYTGLTRLKRHADGSRLTVVCGSQELEGFGRTWPRFETWTATDRASSFGPHTA